MASYKSEGAGRLGFEKLQFYPIAAKHCLSLP